MVSVEAPEMLDVAIVTDEGPIACLMAEAEYARLSADWVRAIGRKASGPQAGCYWMTVDGKPANHGLLLTNIKSLLGVTITQSEKTE